MLCARVYGGGEFGGEAFSGVTFALKPGALRPVCQHTERFSPELGRTSPAGNDRLRCLKWVTHTHSHTQTHTGL